MPDGTIDFFLNLAWRSSAILIAGLIIRAWSRRRSAAERHYVLLLTVGFCALLPLGFVTLPKFAIPQPVISIPPSDSSPSRLEKLIDPESTSFMPTEAPAREETRITVDPEMILLAIWFAGIALGGWKILCGTRALRRIDRDAELLPISPRLHDRLKAFCRGAELPELLVSARTATPYLAGVFRPKIILPIDATSWDFPRTEAVLLHELAHWRRKDHLLPLLLVPVRLFYWWNPFLHIASRRLQIEREAACDNLVLEAQVTPSRYAEILLETARLHLAAPPLPRGAMPMATSAKIHERVQAILDPNLPRRSAMGTWTLTTGVLGIILLIVLCTTRLENLPPASPAVYFPPPSEPLPPGTANPQIEISVLFLEVTKDAYRRVGERIEAAMTLRDAAPLRRALFSISQRPGITLVSAPRLILRLGQSGSIKILNQFLYPAEFARNFQRDLNPISFHSEDLGIELPLAANLVDGRIEIQGNLTLRTLEGFTPGDRPYYTPAFRRSEAHFFHTLGDGQVSGLWIPGEHNIAEQRTQLQKVIAVMSEAAQSKSSRMKDISEDIESRRLAMFLSARLTGGNQVLGDPPSYLLQKWMAKARIKNFRVGDGTIEHAVQKLFRGISQNFPAKDASSVPQLTFHPPEAPGTQPRVNIDMEDASPKDILEELKRQSGYEFVVSKNSIEVRPPPAGSPLPGEANLPYGTPVSGKPGYSTSPYAPDKGYVDLRGFPPGTEVKCPYTNKLFLVP